MDRIMSKSSGNEVCCESERPSPNYGGDLAEAPRGENKMRSIHIEQLDYGYLVRVGCQSFAIEDKDTLLDKLQAYTNDPSSVENSWITKKII